MASAVSGTPNNISHFTLQFQNCLLQCSKRWCNSFTSESHLLQDFFQNYCAPRQSLSSHRCELKGNLGSNKARLVILARPIQFFLKQLPAVEHQTETSKSGKISTIFRKLETFSFEGSKRRQWNHAIEEKNCDLCEEYIEEVDEDKGLHLRELYAELIKLWPKGWMDTMGIKLAVHRAKERRKLHDESYKTRSAKKQQPKSFDDDSASILEMIAKKSPSLWKKAKALNTLKRESKTADEHEHVDKKVKRDVDKIRPFGGGSQVSRT
ncbi:hypothetical protein GOP47_0024453 [Adiantum capillus-veneris]|uniref:Uncharacterized protein n=1 Tax=Adiantum capillus-veneris TaxID=13818 RepID=A0A9D4U2Y7_ADICA|nr:hypothetical protein GOP47_0024453 [Adiantum capillus-veneris]